MDIFKKHNKDTTVKRLLTEKSYFAPKVYITFNALLKMQQYCEQCDKEIGWLGFVKHNVTNDGANSNDHTFTIYDTILCKQEVSAATADLHESGLQGVVDELVANNQFELLNEAKCWGHSHVKMAVNPSGTDEETFEELYQNSDYFIRIIANKENVLKLDIAMFDLGLQFDNIDWEPLYPDNLLEMMKHEEALCKEFSLISEQIEKTVTAKTNELKETIKNEISEKVQTYISSCNKNTTKSNTKNTPASTLIKICTSESEKIYSYKKVRDMLCDNDIIFIAENDMNDIKALYGEEEEFKWYTEKDWATLVSACKQATEEIEEEIYMDAMYGYNDDLYFQQERWR